MTKTLLFFATVEDIAPLLATVERSLPVDYVRMGCAATNVPEMFAAGADIPSLGRAISSSTASGDQFLVVLKGHAVQVRQVNGTDGKPLYFVDQLVNQDSITFSPGGLWGEDVLLYGRFATVSEDGPSQSLMKEFARALRASFRKINVYWVGRKAEALLDAGKRLTISAESPREFDLARTD